jgi:hypothetical protein
MKTKIIGLMAFLLLAIGAVSACEVCPSGYPTQSGGDILAGQSFTLTAPDATSYSWMGVIQGETGVIGLGNTKTITVPSSFTQGLCGREVAIYATATNDKGCVWMKCIWFVVKCSCPTPVNFCQGQATPATEASFNPNLPLPVYGMGANTWYWKILPAGTKWGGLDGHPTEAFLDGLAAGTYTIQLTIDPGISGIPTQTCPQVSLIVYPIPTGDIVKG